MSFQISELTHSHTQHSSYMLCFNSRQVNIFFEGYVLIFCLFGFGILFFIFLNKVDTHKFDIIIINFHCVFLTIIIGTLVNHKAFAPSMTNTLCCVLKTQWGIRHDSCPERLSPPHVSNLLSYFLQKCSFWDNSCVWRRFFNRQYWRSSSLREKHSVGQ